MKFIISGGGTGGHIFPAIAIANALKAKVPEAEILFVGALGRMEMEKVPQAGYAVEGLPVAGIQRGLSVGNMIKNLQFPFKLIRSIRSAGKILNRFRPDVVIGVGGYASGPVLWSAQQKGIPTLIQEQNSYAGLTNKWLAKGAKTICVAYPGMDKYFPADKLVVTGNPVRMDIAHTGLLRLPAMVYFKLANDRKTLLVMGGSLGARTINESVAAGLDKLRNAGFQLIWQTGKSFYPQAEQLCKQKGNGWGEAKAFEFIKEIQLAYAAADVVITRSGALSISELCLAGKPVILVPSPNVAEDHQTKNALALVEKGAAVMVKDALAKEKLIDEAVALLANEQAANRLKEAIATLGKPEAANEIAEEVLKLIVR